MKIYLSDVTTVIANLAGLPALSVPSGMVHGLPGGLQLIGRPLEEDRLFQIARAFERERKSVFVPTLNKIIDADEAPRDQAPLAGMDSAEEKISAYSPEYLKKISDEYSRRDK